DPQDGYTVDLMRGARTPGPDLTMAISFVRSAIRFEKMTEAALFSNYGQLFRAIPYLGKPTDQIMQRLHALYQRHGRAVREVIDREIGRTSISTSIETPATSLILLVQSPFGEPVTQRQDPAESEPAVAS